MQNQPPNLSPAAHDYVPTAVYDDLDALYPDMDYEFGVPDDCDGETAPIAHGDDYEAEYDPETGRWYAVYLGPADDGPSTIAEVIDRERQANTTSRPLESATAATRRALDDAQRTINARLDTQFAISTAEELDDAAEAWLR